MTVPGTNLRSLRQVDLVIFRAILCFIISLDFIVVDLHSPALAIASHQYVKAAVPSGFLHAVLIMEVLAVEAMHHSCVSFSCHCLLLHHFVESLFLRRNILLRIQTNFKTPRVKHIFEIMPSLIN